MDDFEINLDTPKQPSPSQIHASSQPKSLQGKMGSDDLASDGLFSQFDFRRSSHPIACIFHMGFKATAIFL